MLFLQRLAMAHYLTYFFSRVISMKPARTALLEIAFLPTPTVSIFLTELCFSFIPTAHDILSNYLVSIFVKLLFVICILL